MIAQLFTGDGTVQRDQQGYYTEQVEMAIAEIDKVRSHIHKHKQETAR